MATDEKYQLQIRHGFVAIRPSISCRIVAGPPPTVLDMAKGYARSAAIYACVALLIFAGSFAATKNPEDFAKGFVSGLVGYYIGRGISR
jgi:hypothetical protein